MLAGGRVRFPGCAHRETVREIREHGTNRRYTGPVRLADGIEPTDDLEKAVRCPALVLAVPSTAARSVIRDLGAVVLADQIVVHAGPRASVETGRTLSRDRARRRRPIRKLGSGGPNIPRLRFSRVPRRHRSGERLSRSRRGRAASARQPTVSAYANDDVVGPVWSNTLTGARQKKKKKRRIAKLLYLMKLSCLELEASPSTFKPIVYNQIRIPGRIPR